MLISGSYKHLPCWQVHSQNTCCWYSACIFNSSSTRNVNKSAVTYNLTVDEEQKGPVQTQAYGFALS